MNISDSEWDTIVAMATELIETPDVTSNSTLTSFFYSIINLDNQLPNLDELNGYILRYEEILKISKKKLKKIERRTLMTRFLNY